jgi:hypothetical protein
MMNTHIDTPWRLEEGRQPGALAEFQPQPCHSLSGGATLARR